MTQRRTWIKLYVDQTLRGTCFSELDPGERFIWFGFLLLAGDSPWPGLITATEILGYTDEQLSCLLKVQSSLIKVAKRKLVKFEKIMVDENNKIKIINWKRYQSEYERQKPHRQPEFFTLRKSIKERDNYTCQKCNKSESNLRVPLCIHHIDNNPKNNSEDNLITLCMTCHSALLKKAVHKNKGKERAEQATKFRSKVQEYSSGVKFSVNPSLSISSSSISLSKEFNKEIEREILGLWNKTSFQKILQISKERKKLLRARWKEHPDICQWKCLLKKMEESSFLKGANEKSWTASFDWLISNDTNWLKILEGKYDDRKKGKETIDARPR